MDAEEYDFGGRGDSANFLSDLKAVHYGYGEIQNHNVRGQFYNLSKCVLTVCGFATYFPFGVPVE